MRGYQKKLLEAVAVERKLINQMALAQHLDVHWRALKNWKQERTTIPKEVFERIIEDLPHLKRFEKFIVCELQNAWGASKGGKATQAKLKNCNERMKKLRALRHIKRKREAYHEKKLLTRKLSRFAHLRKMKVDLLHILGIAMLTDGYIGANSSRICFYSKNEELRDLMLFVMNELSQFVPKIWVDENGGFFVRVTDQQLTKRLRCLSPTFKTAPGKSQTKEEYLQGPQPTLAFLEKSSTTTLNFCLRVAFSMDGSISRSRKGKYELTLSCYHPTLCGQWLEILRRQNMLAYVGNDNEAWAKVDGIRIYSKESIKRFLNMGGFLKNVRISAKSKVYKGKEKNQLLAMVILGPMAQPGQAS